MLRNIILHHSYHQGLRVKIACSGHTYILGTNGAGKTSALNLIPIFYGKDPSSLVVRTADKKSFIDYYLPNQQSMVVFEYERLNGEVCCSVIYRREAGQYAYRFIKGAADDTLFLEDLEPLYSRAIQANELLKYELPKRNVEVSNQILSTIDYRSIIQNDPMSSGKRRRARSAAFTMSREAREFSLGGVGDKMQHIESLAAVALSKGQLLRSLKTMIVDTQIRDRLPSISTPQAHPKNKDLWNDLASLQEFSKDSARLRKGLDAFAGLQEVRAEIVAHQRVLSNAILTTQAKIRELEQQASNLEHQQATLEEQRQAERNRLGEQEAQHRGTVNELEAWLDRLEDDRAHWEAMDIDAKKRLAEQRSALVRNRALSEKKLKLLTSHVEEIEEKFEQQRKDVERSARLEERQMRDREQELMAQQTALANQAQEQAERYNRECNVALEQLHAASQQALENLRSLVDSLYRQLNEASGNLPEETEEIAMSTEAMDTAQHDLERLEEASKLAQEVETKARRDHDQAMDLLAAAESQERRLNARVQRLAEQLNPAHSTLLAFLRDSGLPWHDTIGKVIDPTLLQRKDLSPQLAEPAALKQVFGLTLDLRVLSRPESAEEDEVLQAQLERTEGELRTTKTLLDQREDTSQKALRELKESEKASIRAKDRVRQGREKVQHARASHEYLLASVEKARKARCQSTEDQIEQARQREKKHKADAEQERTLLQAEHERQRQQHKADHQEDEQRLKDALQFVKSEQVRIEADLAAKCQELGRLRDQAMSEGGVDAETLKTTRDAIDDAKAKLAQIEADQDKILKYDLWRRDQWGQKPVKERELSEAQRLLSEVLREKKSTEEQFQSAMQTLLSNKRLAQSKAKQLKEATHEWNTLIANATSLADEISLSRSGCKSLATTDINVSGNTEQLVAELRRLVSSANRQKQEVLKASALCNNLIGRHPQSMIYQDWQNLRDYRRSNSRHGEGTPSYSIEQMQDVEILLDDRLPLIERALIENVHSIGSVLSDYHEDLRNLNSIVEQVSGRLHRNLNTDHSFDVISDVSVKVRSRIHELGFWTELAAFGESWSQWMTSGRNELPSQELLSRLMLLENQMQHDRMDPNDLESMVDLEIEFYEQERRVPIRTEADLGEASSVGISRLAILVLFSALTRYLCPNPEINITWPIDELGQLAPENIVRVFKMMRERNISLFCAEPKLSHELQGHFDHRVAISKKEGVMTMASDAHAVRDNPLLVQLTKALSADQPSHGAITQVGVS